MKKETIRIRLEARGYKVIGTQNGYMAVKNQTSYKAETLNALWNKINKPL